MTVGCALKGSADGDKFGASDGDGLASVGKNDGISVGDGLKLGFVVGTSNSKVN